MAAVERIPEIQTKPALSSGPTPETWKAAEECIGALNVYQRLGAQLQRFERARSQKLLELRAPDPVAVQRFLDWHRHALASRRGRTAFQSLRGEEIELNLSRALRESADFSGHRPASGGGRIWGNAGARARQI
jgi:hypothetical protein